MSRVQPAIEKSLRVNICEQPSKKNFFVRWEINIFIFMFTQDGQGGVWVLVSATWRGN